MLVIRSKGSFKHTYKFLQSFSRFKIEKIFQRYGEKGVEALRNATPIDSGNTALSWSYNIEINKNSATIVWSNSNINKGANIAILLQYGHATGTGGYVEGQDYINPALKPIFKEIADDLWQEVTNL